LRSGSSAVTPGTRDSGGGGFFGNGNSMFIRYTALLARYERLPACAAL